jgi:pimeloyl-ACP methyl ester carboxylesterase
MKLTHGRVSIELHQLEAGEGTPLLLLHRLGGRADDWDARVGSWPGAVHALDFAGHGRSDRVRGGGYYPEYFMADADVALEAIGDRAALVGAGLGAYVALLLAGTRPDRVPAALLLPGLGLAGGGAVPDWQDTAFESVRDWEARIETADQRFAPGTDPMVTSCEDDLRPLDYVAEFAESAAALLFSQDVPQGDDEPSWWRQARQSSGGTVVETDFDLGLKRLAELCR